MAKKPTITPDQWHEAEALAVQGAKYEEIARRFGISVLTLRARARKEDWPTPGRIAWKKSRASQGVVVAAPETVTRPTGGNGTPAALVPFQEALQVALHASPQEFQNALANYIQALLAAGIGDIPPPRTVSELARMNDIYRKASGLDGRHASGNYQFLRPLRTLRRGPRVVEAVEVPPDRLDGFEI